jgi:serine/threonine protein phosphatase PrpC
MFIDIDSAQYKKYNQNAYGDHFLSKRTAGRVIAVLSDGLGSGIKANILSCMTSVMLLKFIEQGADIQNACEIVMNSLPICKVRKISYSTFSAIDCDEDGRADIVEEGNPQFLWIRDGEVLNPACRVIASLAFPDRKMHIYRIQLAQEDRLIFCSDGVTQAGLGSSALKFGMGRDGLIDCVLKKLAETPDVSSRAMSRHIAEHAKNTEVDGKALDDISAVAVYCREPRESLVFTGPPYHEDRDALYAASFMNFKGQKAVCGGTTANILSRELKIPVESDVSPASGTVPPASCMAGVDLVTEGILTLTRAGEYLENGETAADDAAGQLVRFLLAGDCIHFMVGAKLNQLHYDPTLPVEIEIRKNVVKKIAGLLEEQYIKKVTVQYL